jgi:hypothetical protein
MVKSRIKKQLKKSKSKTRKQSKKIKKQFGGGLTKEDIDLWRGFNGIVNSYINYKIFLKDEWKTDSCKFLIDGIDKEFDFKSKEDKDKKILKQLNEEREAKKLDFQKTNTKPSLLNIHLLMEKCKSRDNETCIVTPDSSGNKLRCHSNENYSFFNKGLKIKIPNKTGENFELIEIIHHIKYQSQKGGNIDNYIKSVYGLQLLLDPQYFIEKNKDEENGNEFQPTDYAKRQISKYLEYGSYFFYLNETKNKLVINFPMYDEPYLSYLSQYHHDTELTTVPIIDDIKVHNGYNDLVLIHIDMIDEMITKILRETPNINYILFTGHSLGSSIIQLTLFYLLAIKKNKLLQSKLKNIKLLTTGAPRVGNYKWFEWWNEQGFKEQIFNIYHIDDTYAITPGVRNTQPYESDEIDDFYPIIPILLDYNFDEKKHEVVTDETKRNKFFYKHFDYLNFKNTDTYRKISVNNHDLSEYEETLKTLKAYN